MVESLINFSDDEFSSLIKERGLEDTTRGVVSVAQDKIGAERMSYESLRDGTAPIFDLLPEYKDAAPEERQLGDEEILTIFTNVTDYGTGSATDAFLAGAAREAPEALAGGFGFSAGVRAAMPVANFIPAVGLPGVVAKGAVILGGGLIGAISAAFAAEEAEKAVIGEQAPVVPSLEGARRWGEGTALGLSLFHAPWTLTSKAPQVSKNVEFLQNFKEVASGRFAANLDDAAEFTALNAGLSEDAFKAAQEASEKLAARGTVFGKKTKLKVSGATATTGAEIGFRRFNKNGLIFDPTAGPLGVRIGAQIEKGITQSLAAARARPKRFLGVEGAAAVGGGFGALVAQGIDPYDESSRFIGEILGAGLVPLPVEVAIDSGPKVIKKLFGIVNSWRSGKQQGLLTEQLKRDGGERILAALQMSENYKGPEQLEVLIDGLINGDVSPTGTFRARPTDPETGEIIPETPAKAAKMYSLPLASELQNIETSLAKRNKELSVSAQKGKEQLLQNAKDTVETLLATGEPGAVLAAARVQQGIFEEAIAADLSSSVNSFVSALKRVRGDDPDVADDDLLNPSNAVELGTKLYNIMNAQIQASKRRENKLWQQTGNTAITSFKAKNGRDVTKPNSLTIFDRPVSRNGLKFASKSGQENFQKILNDYKISSDLKDFDDYFNKGKGRNPVTAKKLFELRKFANDAAAKLKSGANPNPDMSLFMRRLSDAFFQDLMNAPDQTKEYNIARAYTYARNNVFTRSFFGEIQVVDSDRSVRLEPEELARAFFRGGNAATAKRIDEINAGVKFGLDHGLDPEVFDAITTSDAIDFLVRDSLKKFTKQNPDGSFDISEASLMNWRNQPGTRELFTIFPQLEIDTKDVIAARRLLQATNSDLLQKGAAPEVRAFKTVVETADKPLKAISNAITSENPRGNLQHYVNLINKSDNQFPVTDPVTGESFTKDDALKGLRILILDEAVHHAGGLGLGFSPTRFFQRLDEPIKGTLSKDNFNLMDFMTENKLITAAHRKDLTAAIARMRGVEDAYNQGDVEDVLFRDISPVSLLQARIAGATFGQKAQESFNRLLNRIGIGTSGGGIGGGIIAAEAGSEAVVNFLLRGPEKYRVKAMSQLFNDREALGLLLKELKTEQDAREVFEALGTVLSKTARQVGRRLPYAGALGVESVAPFTLPDPVQQAPVSEPLEQQTSVDVPSQVSPPPRLPPFTSNVPPTNINMVSPSLNPIQGTQRVNRQRFADLFPEDAALIRGIGSLPR